MKKIIALIIFLSGISVLSAQQIEGQWNGAFEIQGMKLRIVFHIESMSGAYQALMDSPDQGVKGIHVSSVSFNNPNLKITVDNLGFTYNGVLKNDTLIEGSFSQRGQTFPLDLIKKEIVSVINRPQEPKPPFSYNSENIKIQNQDADIELGGTFTYPKQGDNFPAVVLISGSGAQNRDEEIMRHKPFLVLSDYLTRQGIAVLRYDDRGVGESQGEFGLATSADFASDALAAFNYLKTREEIDTDKIGLVGHSEGGLITFMLAAQNKDIAYIVSMASSAVKGDSLLLVQNRELSKAAGLSDEKWEEQSSDLWEIFRVVESSPDTETIRTKLMEIILKKIEGAENREKIIPQIEAQVEAFCSPWVKYFIAHDPSSDLKKINCPLFALNGDKDTQVDADINLGKIQQMVKSDLTVKKYPGLNHLFQHCITGLPHEYSQIEETISPEVLSDIADWILNQK